MGDRWIKSTYELRQESMAERIVFSPSSSLQEAHCRKLIEKRVDFGELLSLKGPFEYPQTNEELMM